MKRKVQHPPEGKPVLIYDGQCPFCVRSVEWMQKQVGDTLQFLPYQVSQSRFPEIPLEDFQRAVQLINLEGEVFEGAQAVFRALAFNARFQFLLKAYKSIPGFAWFSEWGYRFIAKYRGFFGRFF